MTRVPVSVDDRSPEELAATVRARWETEFNTLATAEERVAARFAGSEALRTLSARATRGQRVIDAATALHQAESESPLPERSADAWRELDAALAAALSASSIPKEGTE